MLEPDLAGSCSVGKLDVCMHSTNYFDTFIAVAPDCTAESGNVPPPRKSPSVALMTYERVVDSPYTHTSDDVLFGVFADRKQIEDADRPAARAAYFSKGQPCFRASPLTKTYGWGAHFDADGRVAIYGRETVEYAALAGGKAPDGSDVVVKEAMRSKR